MIIYHEPRVRIIGHTLSLLPEIAELSNQASPEGFHELEPDATNPEALIIYAGRGCYQSFGSKAGRKTAESYLANIMDVEHFSVIEHVSVSFDIQGVSRALTHELVRHRHMSYSQLSQRFVAPSDLGFVLHPYGQTLPVSDMVRIQEGWEAVSKEYRLRLADDTPDLSFAEKKKVREWARMCLPNETETKIVVTANLNALRHFLDRRDHPAADIEIQLLARKIRQVLHPLVPHIISEER